jgi:hypothetical protein
MNLKIGLGEINANFAKLSHGRLPSQMAAVAIPRNLFADILRLIAEPRPPPVVSIA